MTEAKTQQLTVLLIKESAGPFETALRDPSSLTRIGLKDGALYPGEFWYARPKTRTPQWRDFINPVLESDLQDLTTSSVSAVLFVEAEGRVFAFTFGYGRNLLKPECHELGFGLRVALNRIHHERLRSMDVRTYEELMVSTRKQTSRSAELGAFGLDISRDLLRAVTGEPDDSTFATRLTGADALALNARITAAGLGEKCQQIVEAYQDDRYKQHFDWVDHLNELRDKKITDELNAKLEQALRDGNTEKLHFAPPETVDWQSLEKFRIGGTRQKEYDDLDIDQYLGALGDSKDELTIQKLRSYRVSARWTGSDQFQDKWSLFTCIVWETLREDRLYALVEGKWFEIEKNFAERVRRFVGSISAPAKLLPKARANEREDDYNKRVAAADPAIVCMDGVLVKPEDAATPIEFCDLLSDQKQLIYVKKKTRSATLSHLFAQGTVAARVFLQDGTVRKELREKLRDMGKNTGLVDLIPDETTRPDAPDYEIQYAIITKPAMDWPLSLPFFSQLNLMQNARLLQGLGFRITLQQVEESVPDGDEV